MYFEKGLSPVSYHREGHVASQGRTPNQSLRSTFSTEVRLHGYNVALKSLPDIRMGLGNIAFYGALSR
jgi:hypothetical protein